MASEDQKNNCMIHDGSSDCMIFQQGIKSHAHKHAEMSAKNKSAVSEKCRKIDELKDIPIVGAMKKQLKSSTGIRSHAHKDARMFPTHKPTVSENCNKPDKSEEVLNIEALKEQVKSYIVGHKITSPSKTRETWNDKFHKLLIGCDIKKYYPGSNLPGCYKPGDSCGHILHIDLEDTACNTLQLTMLESVSNRKFSHLLEVSSSFINSLTFENPVWDLGLQFAVAKTNSEKLFNLKKESSQKYLSTCICPFSSLFKYWHETFSLLSLPGFAHCEGSVCKDPMTLLKHLHSMRHDYYHRIIMRQVQNLYSFLIAKLKIPDWNTTPSLGSTSSTLQSIGKGKVSLPTYVFSYSTYKTFTVEK